MHKIVLAAVLLCSLALIACDGGGGGGSGVGGGFTTGSTPNSPAIKVVNSSTYPGITFGYASYKVVNGSSTRQGSGASASIGATGVFNTFPVIGSGDQLYLDKGLRIVSPDSSMSSDGSDTCNAAGFSKGISSVLGRGYMVEKDSFTVTVTRTQTVIPGIYDAVCAYSK